MTQENKELLLKDLCVRLPYGVKVLYEGQVKEIQYIEPLYNEVKLLDPSINYTVPISNLKPYLRPLSSMTEEERHEIQEVLGKDIEIFDDSINIIDSSRKRFSFLELQALLNWLNAHYFDYNHLIEKGLALEAPKDMYRIKTGIV